MTYSPKVIAGPSVEPVSAAEVKLHTKIDGWTEDALLDIYITAAREYFEDHAAYTVHEQTLEVTLDGWPAAEYIELPRATPLISVTSVIYYAGDGTPTTWAASGYEVAVDCIPGRIYLPVNGSWPSSDLRRQNSVRVRYVAGIATASPVTEASGAIKLPILMLVAGMYENRESETFTNLATVQSVSMRYGVEAFIARIRDKVAPSSY